MGNEETPVTGSQFAVRRPSAAPTAAPSNQGPSSGAPSTDAQAGDVHRPPAATTPPTSTTPPQGPYRGSHSRSAPTPPSPTPAPTGQLGPVSATEFLERQRNSAGPGPARWGARGRANRWSAGLLSLPMGGAERTHHVQRASIQRSLDGPRTIVVVNPKGGAAKTTASLMLGYTFGTVRGGDTVVWDNNETRGTLGVRGLEAAHRNTARELVSAQGRFSDVFSARLGDLSGYVRGQGEAHFDLLASDERAEVTGQIDSEDVVGLHQLLCRFYRVVVIDTGNNMRAGNWIEAINRADAVVIPTTTDTDVSYSGLWMLDALETKGMVDPGRCVTVITGATDKRALAETRSAYESRTRAVCTVPHDPALASGRRVDYARLSSESKRAWLHTCATITGVL